MMKTTFHINTTGAPKLEGYREPVIAQSACGHPILPSRGDVVVVNGVALIVDDLIWHMDQDIEKDRVEVWASVLPAGKAEPEKSPAYNYQPTIDVLWRAEEAIMRTGRSRQEAAQIVKAMIDGGLLILGELDK